MDEQNRSQVDLIREAFYYQSRFDGTTMVFKIDFPVTEDRQFKYLMKDLALLAQTGIRIVIVPGAKEWIDAVLKEYDIESSYEGSVRITTEAAIPFVKMAAFEVATRYMTELSASRVDAVIGNFVRARGIGVVNGIDFAHSGMVDKIQAESLKKLMDLGMVPILPCIGWSPAGKPYNLPSDEIALAACEALRAVKFFIVSNRSGITSEQCRIPESVYSGTSGRLARLTPQEAEEILKLNPKQTNEPALKELALAIRACRLGVERVHIVDSREEGAVLRELFSNLGVGTMVYADEYESIRPLKPADITEVLRLMGPLMEKGILIQRNAEQILEKKDDYVVYEVDGSVHACGALHDWGEDQGEIAALATDPQYTDLGLGRRIVGYLIDRARKRNFRRVFVLTTRTHDWFEYLGFREIPVEQLPEKKRKVYNQERKSKVFALDL
ncbi:amino-acid N-acetyltransferase [Gracilinema caldarium]|uniref:amino-acid N-acetyltransferase n=1 Tax=Gracilinema caldarium TaxID=215591 RepID=UPI0026E973C7|nr:amino-acid N-acetyltransferase [Gracilinema caldarium]